MDYVITTLEKAPMIQISPTGLPWRVGVGDLLLNSNVDIYQLFGEIDWSYTCYFVPGRILKCELLKKSQL